MEQSKTNQFNVLAEKPVGSLLMQYAIPAIVAMAASSVYNIIDGIFIGQGVGAEAIMGLALTGPLMSLTAAFGAMVGVGAATLMSVKLGQKDYGTAQKILGPRHCARFAAARVYQPHSTFFRCQRCHVAIRSQLYVNHTRGQRGYTHVPWP